MSCRIEVCEKARKNDNKNGIWNGHALSSSYAILFFRDIYWISLSNAVRRSDLNPSNLNDKGAIGRSTATKIRDGKIVTPNSYFKLMKWMEKEKPEVYKEAMEHILKELGKLKMEE